MRVCIAPLITTADKADGGIRRVSDAQARYLPEFGIQVTGNPDEADLIACHGATLEERPGVPLVAHSHGLMWCDYGFGEWGDKINRAVVDVLTRAQAITAPSKWVAHAISRGMLARPEVIYHGVDADDWAHDRDPLKYVLWNKARVDSVSDPADMQAVAKLLPDVPFISTFGQQTPNVLIIGPRTYGEMKPIVQQAGVYLATARETFGIGTLEALAAGVPVAGWRYGGQEEIIIDGETGYLAEFGDYEGLAECIRLALAERRRLSDNARMDAATRWGWRDKIQDYADLYTRVVADWTKPRPKVSVIVTTHNLAKYLGDALRSVKDQTLRDWECIIIDDASTDDPHSVVKSEWDERFSYRRTPENLKLSGARNYGWQHSTGRYILFLDADDLLAPNALDSLATVLDNRTDVYIAYGGLDTISDDGSNRQRNEWPSGEYSWHGQIAHLNQLPYASMMRREVLERSGGYRVRDWRAEDAAFWSRVTSLGFRAARVTDETTLIYRLRSDSKGATEAREYPDRDGDWTAWLPWRLAGDARDGMAAMREKRQPNAAIVPFGAQGTPPTPLKAWPVRHFQHPVVSVVIPVGPGHARYLVDALDSLQAQTMPEWEAIVVNDSGETLDLSGHPWARVWETHNLDGDGGPMGAGFARNAGLSHARAPLVTFLDADDILHPRALEAMLKAYIENPGRYIYTDCATLEDETKIDGPIRVHLTADYDPQLGFRRIQHAVTVLVETDKARDAGGFDEQLPAWEDWDFFIKLAIAGVCGVRVPHPLLIYRLHSGERRKIAKEDDRDEPTPLGKDIYNAIHDRYAAYISGEVPMASCCGGNAAALNLARQTMEDLMGFASEPAVLAPPEASIIRLEFIGDQWGAQTWLSQDRKRQYRAGRDPHDRYIDVPPEDVEYLVSLGIFRVVPPPPPEPGEQPLTAPIAEPLKAPRVRGRKVA